MWPEEYLSLLAPRAALLVEGTAFRKVARLSPEKLRVNNQSGIQLLVEAIGGSWGATELEERYEFFEKALYGTIQRNDESHDSYLSRMESNFVELLSRGTKLEEVQAYVLLRQSLLAPDDKKKILLEHPGELKYEPVVKSFRLLGSKFFSELQGSRQSAKTKVYDVNLSEQTEGDFGRQSDEHSTERAFSALTEDVEPELDAEFMEVMLAAEDQDALLVNSFEQELEDFLQDVPDMHDAMVTYLEARSKLLEKRRSRGFWPIKPGGKDNRGFGKGKGRGKGKRQRDQLLARIAKSTCRLCNQRGHWKAECPNRDKNPDGGTAVANIVEPSQPSMVQEVHSEPESAPSDVDDVSSGVLPVFSIGLSQDAPDFAEAFVVQALLNNSHKSQLGLRMKGVCQMKAKLSSRAFPMPRYADAVKRSLRSDPVVTDRKPNEAALPLPDVCHLASTGDRPCHAILDTGASKFVIGEKIWKQLFQKLPSNLQQKVRKAPSQVKFRFGNNQTLQSEFQVQLPLQSAPHSNRRLWLTIEVLPGSTPFLFSKRAFKQLGGILDTTNDLCFLQRLDRKIKLELNPTELYLLDVLQLCSHPPKSFLNPVLSQIMSMFNQRVLIVQMGRMILNVQLKISPSQWPKQPQETAAHDRPTNRPVTLSMPPPAQMMTSLKTVAEAVISLLTMLLQFLINQLETVPEGPENSPEVMQAMEGMVLELQNQRTMLQSLMTSAQNAPSRRAQGSTGDSIAGESSPQQLAPRQSPSRAPKTPSEVAPLPMTALRVAQVLQEPPTATMPTAAMTSRVSNWQMIEESEAEVIIDLEGRQIDLNPPSQLGSTTPLGVMIPRASTQMTVADWGQCRVTWGKKHKGRTYIQVLRQDPSYYQWAVARFANLTPDVQDFVRFCQVQMDLDQRSN